MIPLYPKPFASLAVGAASVASDALPAGTVTVRLAATVDCYVAFDRDPTATTSSMLVLGGTAEYFHVRPDDKIAVIQDSGAGTLNVTAMVR